MQATILEIAKRNQLLRGHGEGPRDLTTLNSDRADFYLVAVWSVKAALEQAYEAGRKAAQADADEPVEEIKLARQLEAGDSIRRNDTQAHRTVVKVEPMKNGKVAIHFEDGSISVPAERKYRVI